MSEHAPHAPSSMKREDLCPGSHRFEQGLPDIPSESSIDGDRDHALLELCITLVAHPDRYLNEEHADQHGKYTIEQDRIDRVVRTVDLVNSYLDTGDWEVYSEIKANPGQLVFRSDWWGHSDIVLIKKDYTEVIVIDHKGGALYVDPFENLQGIPYMLGVLTLRNFKPDTSMTFTISQPAAGGIKSWHTTAEQLLDDYLPKCLAIMQASEDPDAPRIPGEEQCQMCRGRLSCPELIATSLTVCELALEQSPIPNLDVPKTLPSVTEMSGQQLADVMTMQPVVRAWMKDCGEEALARKLVGGDIPEYIVTQSSGRRSWIKDTDEVVKSLTKGYTHEGKPIWRKRDVVVEKPISFAKILANPKLSEAQKQRIEDKLLHKPAGKKVLSHVSCGKPDLSLSAALDKIEIPGLEHRTESNPPA